MRGRYGASLCAKNIAAYFDWKRFKDSCKHGPKLPLIGQSLKVSPEGGYNFSLLKVFWSASTSALPLNPRSRGVSDVCGSNVVAGSADRQSGSK